MQRRRPGRRFALKIKRDRSPSPRGETNAALILSEGRINCPIWQPFFSTVANYIARSPFSWIDFTTEIKFTATTKPYKSPHVRLYLDARRISPFRSTYALRLLTVRSCSPAPRFNSKFYSRSSSYSKFIRTQNLNVTRLSCPDIYVNLDF